ncbi:carbohydrate ABC transporter permease [Cellulomonas alba]|uniref:Carbohydrate ABC transporter permease n=1 Tax=Cellulomonas alba TaxID=3053467 RepID=A0ABT7SIK5_9CELL|nr:carbohydrate ABC transporter permease [Cellulomonas alba]MDM7856016.1 carbohydrate ABC transporter permease [Cellulomonas alba]
MSDRVPATSAVGPKRSHTAIHVVLIVGSVLMVLPFFWEVSTSLKTYAESISVPPTIFPSSPVWKNYTDVFATLPFGAQFLNTVIMTVARTVGQVFFCAAAGYAFARLEFPGRNAIFIAFLSVLMVPSQLFLLSQFQLMQRFGLLNTVTALALPGIFSAFGTFLLRQFFLQLPAELDAAARLDGCNPFQVWWKVMLPLAKNGMLALGILTAIWSWNDLLWPLVVNNDPEKMTLSAGLSTLQGQFLTNYPVLMAGSFLASIPMIVLFVMFQKNMLEGIASSGIKG